MTALEQVILDALKGATAQQPLRVDELEVDGTPAQISAAVESLYNRRDIGRCSHTKDGETHEEIWPTGMMALIPTFTVSQAKRPKFERSANPRSERKKAMKSTEYKPRGNAKTLYDIVVEQGPIAGPELVKKANINSGNLCGHIAPLTARGLVIKKKLGRNAWYMLPEQAPQFAKISANGERQTDTAKVQPQTAKTETPVEAKPAGTETENDEPAIDYCLWESGELAILVDGEEQTVLPAKATARLARFLASPVGAIQP